MIVAILCFAVALVAADEVDGPQYQCPGSKVERVQKRSTVRQVWDCNLERSAQQVADRCSTSPSGQGGVGETINSVYAPTSVEQSLITAGPVSAHEWYQAHKKYSGGQNTALSSSSFGSGADYFLQMVYGDADKIGCGQGTGCGNDGKTIVVVCHYNRKTTMSQSAPSCRWKNVCIHPYPNLLSLLCASVQSMCGFDVSAVSGCIHAPTTAGLSLL
ncbi:unnamed protein product [Gongylonema pulchrum]|uniref:SCP domain-containing protein n=1 Tax=Gongylonema pulchrum TaxID=637853 RepID=A0A183DNN6_9BILA|nr:unnamed protein product [Gongylonema pulchrum]